jgi:hypothetical protein
VAQPIRPNLPNEATTSGSLFSLMSKFFPNAHRRAPISPQSPFHKPETAAAERNWRATPGYQRRRGDPGNLNLIQCFRDLSHAGIDGNAGSTTMRRRPWVSPRHPGGRLRQEPHASCPRRAHRGSGAHAHYFARLCSILSLSDVVYEFMYVQNTPMQVGYIWILSIYACKKLA